MSSSNQTVPATDAYRTLGIPLPDRPAWKGRIASLALAFSADPGTFVEVDAIEVQR